MDFYNDDQVDRLLDKIAQGAAKKLNEESPPKQDGCFWNIKYFDFGRTIRISKMNGVDEVGYISVDTANDKCVISDQDDRDLIRMRDVFEMAINSN